MDSDVVKRHCDFQPPAPQPSATPIAAFKLLLAVLFNPLNLWRREHFEKLLVIDRTKLGTRLVVSDPTLIKQILVDNNANYVRDSMQRRVLFRMTGRSLFSADESDWRFQRKILAPYFSANAQATYLPGMAAAAEDATKRFLAADTKSIDLAREMAGLTVDVLGRTLFARGLGESPAAIAASVRRFADINGQVELGDFLGLPPWLPGLRRLWGWRTTSTVRQRAKRIVAETKASAAPSDNDIVSALLSARIPETGRPLETFAIESNVSTLIGAGSDTVAVTLTWAILLMSHTPHIREAVEDEVDKYLPAGSLNLATLDQLVWTRAVIEESMRLYPPSPLIGRMACGEDVLGTERIPAGTIILISPWVLHRHPKLWSEPDRFVPERFLPGQREQIPRFAYLPFGAGPRVCLGIGFAMQEAIVLLATLIRNLRFERADNHPISLRQCITLQTGAPLQMRIKARQA